MPKIPNFKPGQLASFLEANGVTDIEPPSIPLWKGPQSDDEQGGITFSLLNLFLADRERFRIRVIEGLKSESWDHKLFFGNCWHLCEEVYSNNKSGRTDQTWQGALFEYAKKEANDNKFRQDEITHWYRVCQVQFEVYLEYWSNTESKGKSLLSEYSFKVPYYLKDGRTVYLRGKWDDVSLDNGIWVTDHKTKGNVEEDKIHRQLKFDLQTMLYLVAFNQFQSDCFEKGYDNGDEGDFRQPIVGIKYNVIRRPLSGGTGTIRRHKAKVVKGTKKKPGYTVPEETWDHFYNRLKYEVIANDPGYFFMKWECKVSLEDIKRFCKVCLNGLLTQLCDWYDWVSSERGLIDPFANSIHFLTPFGLWNPLLEGTPTELDRCVETGSTIGLSRITNLFPEL